MAEIKDCQASILELKLGHCFNAPQKRYYKDLEHIAGQLNMARNSMVRAWIRWREDHPEFQEGMNPGRIPDPNPRSKRTRESGEQSFINYLWRCGGKVAKDVSATLVSNISREVVANLRTDVSGHNHGFRWRWEAILNFAENATSFREFSIPVPRSVLTIGYDGLVWSGMNTTKRDKDYANLWCRDHALICFPLWSKFSGRGIGNPFVRIEVGQLSKGNRTVLKRILREEYLVCDSRVTEREGQWYLQLCYRRPNQDLGLNKEHKAILWPTFTGERKPFLIDAVDHSPWWVGHGDLLVNEFKRLQQRRLAMRSRYRDQMSGGKGHGRQRFEMKLKPYARSTHNQQSVFCWNLIREILRYCKKHDCGKVIYREPGLALRVNLWLGGQDVPFDYTGLLNKLTFKLNRLGIELEVVPVLAEELRQKFPQMNRNGKPPSSNGTPTKSRFLKRQKTNSDKK